MSVRDWIEARRAAVAIACRPVPWTALEQWRHVEGRLVHRTGRFFSVAGLRRHATAWSPQLEQPIIDQPEIGILGWLIRRDRSGSEILLQAKPEPGNVGGIQVGPSVQATESNYGRVHGGHPTPHVDLFLRPPRGRLRADALQSEQGTRFLGKFNRNATVDVTGLTTEPASEDWRWFPVRGLLDALGEDYLVNTDARSSLCCSDWSALAAPDAPFARWRDRGGFGEALLESSESRPAEPEGSPQAVRHRLEQLRAQARFTTEPIPIDQLKGWRCGPVCIVDDAEADFEVRGFEIAIPNREVMSWDQPLVHAIHRDAFTLLCQRRGGVLRFALRASVEIGFREGVQLGPTIQRLGPQDDCRHPAGRCFDAAWRDVAETAAERSSCWQSDEGGRFHHSVARYAVAELGEDCVPPPDPSCVWVTLSQLRLLARETGILTNEARSAASLLLQLL